MVKALKEFIRDVRVAMDTNYTMAVTDSDTLSYGDIIRSKIEEAVRRVHLAAPIYLLDCGHNMGQGDEPEKAILWNEGGKSGRLKLPLDFLRLVVFKMTDWKRPVYLANAPEGRTYERQYSDYGGVRGTSANPVCVLTMRPQGEYIEFYGCKSSAAKLEQAVYIPEPKITDEGGDEVIEVSTHCYKSAVLMAAALTAITLGESQRAQELMALAQGDIKVNQTKEGE